MAQRAMQMKEVTRYLRILFRTVQAHSRIVEKECGLSSAKLWMLHEIHSTPGIKVSRLATALTIHPSTCSNMLDKLEEDGFVCRERSRTDQRAVHLSITDKATALLARAPRPAQGELSLALAKLSDANLEHLEKSLGELVQLLREKDENAGLMPIQGD